MDALKYETIVLKRLQTAFAICFVLSLVFKSISSLTTLQLIYQSKIGLSNNIEDVESTACSTNYTSSDKEKCSIGSKMVKLKDSAQTLVSDKISIKNIKDVDRRELNIQMAECINLGETYVVEDSSEMMTTQQILHQNLSMPNLPIERCKQIMPYSYNREFDPSAPQFGGPSNTSDIQTLHLAQVISRYPSSHTDLKISNIPQCMDDLMTDNEYDHYYDDCVDSKKIRILNISEIPTQTFIQSSPKFEHKNSKKETLTTKFNHTTVFPLFDAENFNPNAMQSKSAPSANVFLEELSREIRENDLHKLMHEESIENLRSGSAKVVRGSFSKTLKNSISSSTLNMSYNKHKTNTHTKSSSLSALNINKAKMQSPLKKILNLKDAPDKRCNKESLHQSDFDMHLINNIRTSPKKKASMWSLNSKTKNSLTRSSSTRNEYIFVEKEESDDYMNNGDSSQVSNEFSPLQTRKIFKENFTNMFSVVNNLRNFSGNTDKSTTSSNSLPSGYYGQYDKEKWQAFKKVADEGNPRLDLSNLSQISTSTIPQILDTPVNVLSQD